MATVTILLAAPALDADLWAPLRGLLFGVVVLLVLLLAVWMVAVAAPGKMGDISRWLLAIVTGKLVHRFGGSALLIVCGIGAELHFGPGLFIDPKQVGLGVAAGIAAIVGGVHVLTRNPVKPPRLRLLTVTAVVTAVLVSGSALGPAVGQATS